MLIFPIVLHEEFLDAEWVSRDSTRLKSQLSKRVSDSPDFFSLSLLTLPLSLLFFFFFFPLIPGPSTIPKETESKRLQYSPIPFQFGQLITMLEKVLNNFPYAVDQESTSVSLAAQKQPRQMHTK